MYRYDDRGAAVREIQKYLGGVSADYARVRPNGVFDENTKDAIKAFQKREKLEENGVVNLETFNALYKYFAEAREAEEAKRAAGGFINFPLAEGMLDEFMLVISNALSRLLSHYRIEHTLRQSRYYSKDISEAVVKLRKIYRMKNSAEIDELFYGRMMKDLDSIAYSRLHFS